VTAPPNLLGLLGAARRDHGAARRDYGAPGALAVLLRDGERTFAASGTADLDGTLITESTRFRIASITKPIVAALALDAVARGELARDDVVGDLLPGVLRAGPPVTVRQLLDHTSGIYDESNGIESQDQLKADIAALADPDLRAAAQADMARTGLLPGAAAGWMISRDEHEGSRQARPA